MNWLTRVRGALERDKELRECVHRRDAGLQQRHDGS